MNRKKQKATTVIATIMLCGALIACGPSTYNSGAPRNSTSYSVSYMSAESNDTSFNTEEYNAITEDSFSSVKVNPLSTFSADVDTASYSNIRRMLHAGYLPKDIPTGAVRIEEMLNYFHYDYTLPEGTDPFAISIAATDAPWNPEHGLIRIGLKTEPIDFSEIPRSNLVFLLDISGSMYAENKLPLLKESFAMLTENLGEKDRVSIVTYAGDNRVVLDGVCGNEKEVIMQALYDLEASGSTNGGGGIQRAYDLAEQHFILNGNNRIILATDGDLNVGETSESALKDLVQKKKKSGIYLTVLGFGTGNIKDNKMETLADSGNGNYAYIDSVLEARRVLVEEMGSTLVTVAEDVKIQVEFNPAWIQEYRLIGYENRKLEAKDFTDDTKDAGEVGAGHSVTALYEVIWADQAEAAEQILKYQQNVMTKDADSEEFGTVKIRYKRPQTSDSIEMQAVIQADDYKKDIQESGLLLEASITEFGLLLRDSDYKGNASYAHILEMWSENSDDLSSEIQEFLELVNLCRKAD